MPSGSEEILSHDCIHVGACKEFKFYILIFTMKGDIEFIVVQKEICSSIRVLPDGLVGIWDALGVYDTCKNVTV